MMQWWSTLLSAIECAVSARDDNLRKIMYARLGAGDIERIYVGAYRFTPQGLSRFTTTNVLTGEPTNDQLHTISPADNVL
jgi:hypothetical protein